MQESIAIQKSNLQTILSKKKKRKNNLLTQNTEAKIIGYKIPNMLEMIIAAF